MKGHSDCMKAVLKGGERASIAHHCHMVGLVVKTDLTANWDSLPCQLHTSSNASIMTRDHNAS